MADRFRHLLISGLVLVIALAITLLLWSHERENAERDLQAELDFSLREAASRIEQRMAAYEQMLRGVQGFYATVARVDRDDFRSYIDSLQLSADFSGIHGIGLALIVPPGALAAHTAAMRRAGLPAYRVFPPGQRESYAPIIQAEPYIGKNLEVLGYDPLADPVRRKAMQRAADSGSASITQRVRLMIENADSSQAGCVMYLPIYRRGAAHDTPEQRRAALAGWIFAYFRVNDLMASLYGERRGAIDIALHDRIERNPESLLYDSAPGAAPGPALEATEYLAIAGATWVLTVRAGPDYANVVGRDQSRVIFFAGAMFSFLLALVCWQMLAARSVAVGLAREMTEELRKSEERALHLAQHDPLTGLPNRALFADRLNQALSLARRDDTHLALMFIDLDYFKMVNDDHGHGVGDLLLQAVAARLREAVRESDTVGRIGGDEFVVLLPTVGSRSDAQVVAGKIRESLAHPFPVSGHTLNISASIGIAVFPDHGDDEDSLRKAADDAMYAAKARERNCIEWALDAPA